MQLQGSPLIVGKISGVYGIKGWLKLNSYTRPRENILNYLPLFTQVDDHWQQLNIEQTQMRGDRLLIKIVEVDSPEQARNFVNTELAMDTSRLPELQDGEYYWHQLIGLDVYTNDDLLLGKVEEILETGANDVLAIRPQQPNAPRVLIPLVMGIYVTNVDPVNARIFVDWQTEE